MKLKGGVTINLKIEEREFLLRSFKKVKGKNDLEKRIIKRTLLRLMGQAVTKYPLYPDKECPHCERTYSYIHYETHLVACSRRYKESVFEVDPEILKRIEME